MEKWGHMFGETLGLDIITPEQTLHLQQSLSLQISIAGTPHFQCVFQILRVKENLWETVTFAKAHWEFQGSELGRKWPLRMGALTIVALLPWRGTIRHFQSPTMRANFFHTVLNQWHWEKSETRNVPWHACQHKSSPGRSPESNWASCT